MRRLIICCDGTWQSALYQTDSSMLTNISRLYTAVERRGMAPDLPVEQLKLYLPGVGTGEELACGIVAGMMGDGVLEKVREASYWLAQNYEQGTTFTSTGSPEAPTSAASSARTRAPTSKNGRKHAEKLQNLLDQIQPFREEQLRGYKGGFLIKILALFDTVPLYHFRHLGPDDTLLPHQHPFGLSDEKLEPHTTIPTSRSTGSSRKVQEYLALDLSYILNLSARRAAPWGQLKPHHGFGHSLHAHDRPLPHGFEHHTQQYYHASILEQSPPNLPRKMAPLFFPLTPFEQKRKITWPIYSAPPSSPVPDPPGSPSPAASEPASPANAPASPFHPAFRPAAPSPPVISASSASTSTRTPCPPSSDHTHVHLTHLRQTRRILRTISGEGHRLVQDVKVERAKIRAAGDSPGGGGTRALRRVL
ncbi:hypothetical protein JCM1841_004028 [Sporobolomyces salmonicolor]